MHPVICSIGNFNVYSYGLMLVVAFLTCTFLACRQAKRHGFDPDIIFNFLFFSFMLGILGARIFYVVENLGYYLREPIEIFRLQHGGLSWFGGLISGVITSYIYLSRKKQDIYKVLDLVIPYVALGQSIGRMGCFFNGCCFGKISEFGIYFPVHQAILIPTQIYSSLLLVLIFVILRYLQDRPHWKGQIFFSYLFLYSIKRFFVEFLRMDNPAVFLGLTLFQLLSIALFIFTSFILSRPQNRKPKSCG